MNRIRHQQQFQTPNKRQISLNFNNCKFTKFQFVEFPVNQIQMLSSQRKINHVSGQKPVRFCIVNENIVPIQHGYNAYVKNYPVNQLIIDNNQKQNRLKTNGFYVNPQSNGNCKLLHSAKQSPYKYKNTYYDNNLHIQTGKSNGHLLLQSDLQDNHYLKTIRSSSNFKEIKSPKFSNQRKLFNKFNMKPTFNSQQINLSQKIKNQKNQLIKYNNLISLSKKVQNKSQNFIRKCNTDFYYQTQQKLSQRTQKQFFSQNQREKVDQIKAQTNLKVTKYSLKQSIKSLWDANQVVSILNAQSSQLQPQSFLNQCYQISYLIEQDYADSKIVKKQNQLIKSKQKCFSKRI